MVELGLRYGQSNSSFHVLKHGSRLTNGCPRHPDPNPLEPMSITLYGIRDFAEGTKLRILRWGDSPGLSSWALNVIIDVLI